MARKSSVLVFALGLGAMFVLLYVSIAGARPVFTDQDGIEHAEVVCTPADKELKFGYTCADFWEAERIAKADPRVIENTGNQPLRAVAYAYVDEAGPHGVSMSENSRQYPFLTFLARDGSLVSVWVDLDSKTVVDVYE